MKIEKIRPDLHVLSTPPYKEMYVTLFKSVTFALCMIDDNEILKARALLIAAQQETERLYIEAGE